MKKLLIIYLFLIGLTAPSQPFTEVVQQDSTSKEVLYSRAHSWVNLTFTTVDDVIQTNDREAGTLIVRSSFPVYYRLLGFDDYGGEVYYTLNLEVKSGRYRYAIDNIQHILPSGKPGLTYEELAAPDQTGYYKRLNAYYTSQTEDYLNGLIEVLKKSMQAPSSDW